MAPVPSRAQVERVEQELARTSAEVAHLAEPALRALAPVLAQAQRETVTALRTWTRQHGDARYTAQVHRSVLAHLERAFTTIKALDPVMGAALEKAGANAGRMAGHHLVREIAGYSRAFGDEVPHLPLNMARILATGERQLIPRYRASAARYAGNVGDDIRRELAVGILRRESVYELTTRLARIGGPRGLVALRGVAGEPGAVTEHIGEGLFRRYRSWGERVVRTETQNAYNTQIDEGLREARETIPDLQRRWDASADLRICPRCAALDGAVAPIDGEFPGGITGAPLHPNCRCRVGAWRAAWSQKMAAARRAAPPGSQVRERAAARRPGARDEDEPRETPTTPARAPVDPWAGVRRLGVDDATLARMQATAATPADFEATIAARHRPKVATILQVAESTGAEAAHALEAFRTLVADGARHAEAAERAIALQRVPGGYQRARRLTAAGQSQRDALTLVRDAHREGLTAQLEDALRRVEAGEARVEGHAVHPTEYFQLVEVSRRHGGAVITTLGGGTEAAVEGRMTLPNGQVLYPSVKCLTSTNPGAINSALLSIRGAAVASDRAAGTHYVGAVAGYIQVPLERAVVQEGLVGENSRFADSFRSHRLGNKGHAPVFAEVTIACSDGELVLTADGELVER